MKSLFLMSIAASALANPAPGGQGPEVPSTVPRLGGPAIPGVCFFSRSAVLANSKLGKATLARLHVLATEADGELAPDRQALDTAVQAGTHAAPGLGHDQAVADKRKALETHAQLLAREMDATREKAFARISSRIQPIVVKYYDAAGCGLLLDRNSVLGGNMTNDVTPAVVRAVDAGPTMTPFDREILAP